MKIGKVIALVASMILVTQINAITSVSSAPIENYPIHTISFNNLGAAPATVTATLYIGNGSGQACTAAQQEPPVSVAVPARKIAQVFVQGDRLAGHGLQYNCVVIKIVTSSTTAYDAFAVHADHKKYDSASPNAFSMVVG